MFFLVVFPSVAVQGLHKVLPIWRPESAKLASGEKKDAEQLVSISLVVSVNISEWEKRRGYR